MIKELDSNRTSGSRDGVDKKTAHDTFGLML